MLSARILLTRTHFIRLSSRGIGKASLLTRSDVCCSRACILTNLSCNMASHRFFSLRMVYVLCLIDCARSLDLSEFYPFGKKSGDVQLRLWNHKLVNLSTVIMFNGEAHNDLYVNSNGAISFNSPLSKHSQNIDNHNMIAPFYTDHMSRRSGKVFYRQTQEEHLLLLASAEVHAGFAYEGKFEATGLVIATWLNVGQALVNETISFQVVLISDGKKTFVLFHYNDKASDISKLEQRLKTIFPKAGFHFGHELRKFYLPNSATSDIFLLSKTSNVNVPGKWLYEIGSRDVLEPQMMNWIGDGALNGGPVKRSIPGNCGMSETECGKNATCDNECCVCNSGYYGNGKMCVKNGQSLHMTGTLSGSINDINLDKIRFSVFGDAPSKTTYIALDAVPPSIGVPLRVLTPMVSTLGFLFAYPGESTGNGFSFLGDDFSRRAKITFDTGEIVNIRENMLGKDQNDFYKFEILIDGNVPVFDARKEVEFDNYIHTYRYDRLGIMSGYYSSVFNVGGEKFKVNVVEVLEFDEVQGCMSVGSSKMAVSEQRGSYDGSKEILNFALKTEMQDETCGEEKRKCHRHARCVVKSGVEYCNCNIGFNGDGYSCQDVDECLLNIHDCSPNANCNNNLGSYNCKCHNGYSGDGTVCDKEEGTCGNDGKKCHPLAQCVSKGGVEICECIIGFIGDGESCDDADECVLGIDQCSVNAACANSPGSYTCLCNEGYTGDGETCQGIVIGSGDTCGDGGQCDSNEECIEGKCQCRTGFLKDGSICTDVDECQLGISACGTAASCSNTVGSYKCTCNEGYSGDGYECLPEESGPLPGCHGNECDNDAHCDKSGSIPRCRCNQGYQGDGLSCADINECDDGKSSCHSDAYCSNTVGSYTCECRPGYLGDGRECVYDDPCEGLSCSFYARCVERDGIPTCQCYAGYYGDGQNCRDYNECEAKRDLCDENARCANNAGSYKCFCLAGYVGDGFTCESDGSCGGRKCHRNAKCAEIYGFKQCQCKEGFVGSGLICVDSNECSNNSLVECPPFSKCFNTPGSYKCRCDAGYQWNDFECKPVCSRCLNGGQCLKSGCLCLDGYSGDRCQWVGDEFLVFAQGSTMQRLSLPPTQDSIGVLLQTTRGLLVALDFDYNNKMIYFTDVARKAIWRVAFNGTGTEKIISHGLSSPEGIAVDYIGGNLYWTDSMFDRVEVSKLDGSDRKVLFSTRLINPRSIVVHPKKGTMYWADWNREAPKIEVANMDGGSRRVLIQQRMGLPNGLTLDRRNDELCWTDAMYGSISCVSLDDGRSDVVYSAARYPFGITSFGQYLIWTDWDARTIQRYDRQNFLLQHPIRSFRGSSGLFYEIKAVRKPEEIGSNECSNNNGGCSNLCLSKPGGRTCACANGYYLVSKTDTMRLRGLGSGLGSGSGMGQSGPPQTGPGSGLGSGLGSGSGQGSGYISQGGPTSVNSTNASGETVCVSEETYKALGNLS